MREGWEGYLFTVCHKAQVVPYSTMAEFTHYIYICVYTHHIWRPQGGSSHGAGPWASDVCDKIISS